MRDPFLFFFFFFVSSRPPLFFQEEQAASGRASAGMSGILARPTRSLRRNSCPLIQFQLPFYRAHHRLKKTSLFRRSFPQNRLSLKKKEEEEEEEVDVTEGRFRRWEEKGNKESMNRWTWTWLRGERNTFGRYFARSVITRPKEIPICLLINYCPYTGPPSILRKTFRSFSPSPTSQSSSSRAPFSTTTLIILICPTIVHFYYSHILRTFSPFYFPPFRIHVHLLVAYSILVSCVHLSSHLGTFP